MPRPQPFDGISDYEGTSADLAYCSADALDLYRTLASDPSHWRAANMTLLVDSQATEAAIQAAFTSGLAAAEADPEGDVGPRLVTSNIDTYWPAEDQLTTAICFGAGLCAAELGWDARIDVEILPWSENITGLVGLTGGWRLQHVPVGQSPPPVSAP